MDAGIFCLSQKQDLFPMICVCEVIWMSASLIAFEEKLVSAHRKTKESHLGEESIERKVFTE